MSVFDAEAEARLMAATRDIAAEEILPRFRALDAGEIDTKSAPDDLVTIADRESERRLEEAVSAILPGAVTFGEEGISEGRTRLADLGDAELSVVVDPVDGTWNFANGLSVFGVILAVMERGRTLWGGIYDPIGDDWMVARRGHGAWSITRDGRRTALSLAGGAEKVGQAHALVPAFMFTGDRRRQILTTSADFARSGNYRCSAHEYRLLAGGRVDTILTASLNPWDHSAGALIVEEAGGVARLLDGRAYDPTIRSGNLLTARNEALWADAARRFAFLV
ncbi:inositol monophosphatase [Alphaproteobacteria bacterium GH1-50]|uniref:Inositol monophosphatase n=1 Tax=Kangsaoukella pontilimi TaxID=2691042 RepID=A0A7C9MWV9_9RHOB|nr:inositol monophosphatase [Kangsaoukella pontilimi]MXQ08640.1 inositol monophosphatase [Kangsaoukella pontilimi]